jgi:serine/threonine-protein kinase
MGVVCAATHLGLNAPVAVKLIRSDLKHDHESVVRFLNEARTAASLKGEHIARVYDVGQLDSGEPYLVMEQLDGMPLDAYIEERAPLPIAEAVDIVLQACEGLAEAHAVALVHRDIKAANLYLARRPDGQFVLKILDFGISKRLIEGARRGLTDPGRSMGSPWYMSPEQMMNPAQVDQRADVWSLGVLLYELLTNDYPFDGEGVVQVCANVLTATAPAPSGLRPEIEPELDAVVLRCLRKSPQERYPSVTALAEALRPFGSKPLETASTLASTSALPANETLAAERKEVRRSRETASQGSLVPVAAAPESRRPRSRTSPVVTALFSLILGAAITWIGWPYVHERYGVPDWSQIRTQLSRAHLPWDPVLAPDPPAKPLRFERDSAGLASDPVLSASAAPIVSPEVLPTE